MLIPPASFLLFFGFLRTWKKHLVLFLPAFLFLVFHSYFPNKQERFILTIVPFLILLGVIGWYEFAGASSFWNRHPKLLRGLITFSVTVNFILLPFISTMYSKRSRVEAMIYLSKYPDVKGVVVEDSKHPDVKIPPEFYLGQWIYVDEVSQSLPLSRLKQLYARSKP